MVEKQSNPLNRDPCTKTNKQTKTQTNKKTFSWLLIGCDVRMSVRVIHSGDRYIDMTTPPFSPPSHSGFSLAVAILLNNQPLPPAIIFLPQPLQCSVTYIQGLSIVIVLLFHLLGIESAILCLQGGGGISTSLPTLFSFPVKGTAPPPLRSQKLSVIRKALPLPGSLGWVTASSSLACSLSLL